MRLLIAVRSWAEHFNSHDAIRASWGAEAASLGIQTRFFVSEQAALLRKSDEILVHAPDSEAGVPRMTREIFKWAAGKQIDYLFLAYPNTLVSPVELMNTFLQVRGFDYAGKFESSHLDFPWASGRDGYFLSRNAFGTLSLLFPTDLPEDQWVGQALGPLVLEKEITYLDTK